MLALLEGLILGYRPLTGSEDDPPFVNWWLNREVWPEIGRRLGQARQAGRYAEADEVKTWLTQQVGVQVRDAPQQSLILPMGY